MPAVSQQAVEQLTTTEAAVLALLAIEGERSGYALAKAVEKAIGHIWAPARSGLFAALYPVLRAMEEAGRIRRGYFVDGLGGSQFALPGAVDRLRDLLQLRALPAKPRS